MPAKTPEEKAKSHSERQEHAINEAKRAVGEEILRLREWWDGIKPLNLDEGCAKCGYEVVTTKWWPTHYEVDGAPHVVYVLTPSPIPIKRALVNEDAAQRSILAGEPRLHNGIICRTCTRCGYDWVALPKDAKAVSAPESIDEQAASTLDMARPEKKGL